MIIYSKPIILQLRPRKEEVKGVSCAWAQPCAHISLPLGFSNLLTFYPSITIFLSRLYFLSTARQPGQFTAVY